MKKDRAMKIRKPFSRVAVEVDCSGKGAKQSMKDECDVNNIMARYEKTGVLAHVNATGGRYEDVADAVDYQSALEMVERARASFMVLPAEMRSRFGNDPAKFLDFVNDPGNAQEMVELGLLPGRKSDGEPNKAAEPPEQGGETGEASAPTEGGS